VEQIPAVTFIEQVDPADPERERAVFVSPQVEEMLGCSPQAWMSGGPRAELVHPDDRGRVLAERMLHRITGEPLRDEYRLLTGKGSTMWVREETKPVLEGSGSLAWQGVLFDVTSHRVSDEMKSMFLVAVSHELRTPLASVLGSALTLDREGFDLSSPEARELIGALATNARKLNRLLSDLLDLDRLDRGILEPRRVPVDLGGLIRQVVDESTVLTGRRVEVAEAGPVAEVDPAMFERIVENLLVNSARHTPAGTPMWVRVEPHRDGVLLTVEDAGPGVPEELRGSIFEPFRQGPSSAGQSPGVGIGLALVARFAELHAGRAWVEERPGGGASFKVWVLAPVELTPSRGPLVGEPVG
jgi:PAS domain S-box-containing protein